VPPLAASQQGKQQGQEGIPVARPDQVVTSSQRVLMGDEL